MSLPPAVQRNAARADELAKQFAASRTGEPPAAPTEPAPTGEPPAAPTEPAPTGEPPTGREDWKQKYLVLKGKYDAEVPTLTRQVGELSQNMTGLRQVIAAMQTGPAPQNEPAASAEFEFDPRKFLTKDELDDYGEDMIGVVGRIVEGIVRPVADELRNAQKENASLRKELGGVSSHVAQSAKHAIMDRLDREVGPDWIDINSHPEFLRWLEERDPIFGITRKQALTNAFNADDAAQCVRIFKAYKEHANLPAPNPSPAPAPSAQPAADTQGGKKRLETLAAPGKGHPTANGGAPSGEVEIVTRDEIKRFYADVTAGQFKGREDEQRKIEAKIHAAVAAGRVQ